jgi:hypothetical protein
MCKAWNEGFIIAVCKRGGFCWCKAAWGDGHLVQECRHALLHRCTRYTRYMRTAPNQALSHARIHFAEHPLLHAIASAEAAIIGSTAKSKAAMIQGRSLRLDRRITSVSKRSAPRISTGEAAFSENFPVEGVDEARKASLSVSSVGVEAAAPTRDCARSASCSQSSPATAI